MVRVQIPSPAPLWIIMARHLHQITLLVSQHLNHRSPMGLAAKQGLSSFCRASDLSAPLYLAFIQGEALLRLGFFTYLKQRAISQPDNLLQLWQQLVEDHQFIQQIAENSSLPDFFNFKSSLVDKTKYQEQCYIAYCILLFDAHEAGNNKLTMALTKGLVVHFMPSLFPKQAKAKDIKTLKHEIIKYLTAHYGVRADIKESFVTSTDLVTFSLLCKLPKKSLIPLLSINGKRLKPTRLKCYQAVLAELTEQQSVGGSNSET